MSTLVAIATYNERENLPSLVEAVRAELPEARVLVVDDDSPDGTGQWCDEAAAANDWFAVIHRPEKLGLGSAAWTAMQWAIERGFDWLVTLDADWSHPPSALPQMFVAQQSEGADVVIGSRYCPGGAVENWPWSRWIVSECINAATRLTLGLPVRDASTAYRLYRVELLARLDFAQLQENGYAYLEEMLWRLNKLDAVFAETPITFTQRRFGESKATAGEALGKLHMLVRLGWRRATGR